LRNGIDNRIHELRQECPEEQDHFGVGQAYQQPLQEAVAGGRRRRTRRRIGNAVPQPPQLAGAEIDKVDRTDPAHDIEPGRHEDHDRGHASGGSRDQQGQTRHGSGQRDETAPQSACQRVGDDQRHVGPWREAQQHTRRDESQQQFVGHR
jgi:hypothetical protein